MDRDRQTATFNYEISTVWEIKENPSEEFWTVSGAGKSQEGKNRASYRMMMMISSRQDNTTYSIYWQFSHSFTLARCHIHPVHGMYKQISLN
jgi:hypothetical protein